MWGIVGAEVGGDSDVGGKNLGVGRRSSVFLPGTMLLPSPSLPTYSVSKNLKRDAKGSMDNSLSEKSGYINAGWAKGRALGGNNQPKFTPSSHL